MDDRTPLLRDSSYSFPVSASFNDDIHTHFCLLAGITPSNLPKDAKWPKPSRTSIYQRAKRKEALQSRKYLFTATVTNSLLLIQIVIGATLTALGASNSPGIYVAVFGALNTIIAGLVTYLKSRGQPMRSRMFKDDLERVIDEVENSETMWLGIASRVHGYSAIDTADRVSVRSEIARLTRLYNEAVRNNTNNNPDLYLNSTTSDDTSGLISKPANVPVTASRATAAVTTPAPDPDPDPVTDPVTDPKDAPASTSKTSDRAPEASKDNGPAEPNGSITVTDTTASLVPKSTAAPASNNDQTAPSHAVSPPAAMDGPGSKSLATDIDEGPVTMDIPDKGPATAKGGSK